MLIPIGEPNEHPNPTRRANVERVRRFILVRANNVDPSRVLVVCQQGLERALLGGPLPDTVDVANFNALTGSDAWKEVAIVIVIGRLAPPVREVERIARVVFGIEVQEVEPDDKGYIRYPQIRRGIRMRDGRGIGVDGPSHPDPRVKAIRWAICEGKLIQAIGRGRGVNRTEASPLQIDILTNVCSPIEVDEVTTWAKIQPGAMDVMCAHGAIPLGYRDMADAYPDLFPTRDTAKMAIRRENPEQTSIKSIPYRRMFRVSAVRYRRAGSRGPAGTLFYDPTRIDPLTWLTEHLSAATLLPNAASAMHDARGGLAIIPNVPLATPEFDEDSDERLSIVTEDGGRSGGEARAAIGLPKALLSFFAIVDEVMGGGYPTEEDWLEATRRWIETGRLRRCALQRCNDQKATSLALSPAPRPDEHAARRKVPGSRLLLVRPSVYATLGRESADVLPGRLPGRLPQGCAPMLRACDSGWPADRPRPPQRRYGTVYASGMQRDGLAAIRHRAGLH